MKEKEEKKEIVVLDSGIEGASLIGPLGLCCYGAFMPYRG